MSKRRSISGELKRFFAATPMPVYLLDAEHRFSFGNAALAERLDVDVASLVGRQCRYHSRPLEDPLDELAAALAPPPDLVAGQALCGWVQLPSPTGRAAGAPAETPCEATWIAFPADESPLDVVIGILDTLRFPHPDPTFEQLQQLHTQLAAFREQMRRKYPLDCIIGTHPATNKVRAQLDVATSTPVQVTIVAPTFGDRERIGRAIFYNRPPLQGRLLPLSCDLLDPELLESSLESFRSSRADSFTGEDVPDTLFFLDIDQLSAECQSFLERELRRGWDYHVIATTARELASCDFSARLAAAFSTLTIRILPLSERVEDIPLLSQHFVERWNQTGRQKSGVSKAALEYLEVYNWPGDIDELAEVIEEACSNASTARIELEDLPRKIHWWVEDLIHPRQEHEPIELDQVLRSIEERLVQKALELSDGNKSQAARLLGITRMRVIRRTS